MQKYQRQPRRLPPRLLLAAMLCAAFGLTLSSSHAEGEDKSDSMDIMSHARAARLLDHGSGGGIRLIIINQGSRQARDVKIPVLRSSLKLDLILPFTQIEVKPVKPKSNVAKRTSRWRSNAFQKWKKQRGK